MSNSKFKDYINSVINNDNNSDKIFKTILKEKIVNKINQSKIDKDSFLKLIKENYLNEFQELYKSNKTNKEYEKLVEKVISENDIKISTDTKKQLTLVLENEGFISKENEKKLLMNKLKGVGNKNV